MNEKTIHPASFLPLPLVRVVSFVLALTLLVGDPSFATGLSELYHASFSTNLKDLSVPSKFGTLSDRWTAPRPAPFVVLIQDLHANIGVQKNIAGIIEILNHRYSLSNVYSEAAFGRCEPAALRTIESRRAQAKLIDKLLSQALLTGEELAAARAGNGGLSPLHLNGVDDPLLYFANVQAFRDLVRVGPAAAQEWKGLKDLLGSGASPQLRRHLDLTEKLLGLKLLDSDWIQYKEHRNLTPQGSPTLSEALKAAERFYTAAEARNGAITSNLLSALKDSGETPVALVTGGFHTATIAHNLKSRGISFAVVTPQVERLDQEELYRRSMTEPPHETVRAIAATITDIQTLKSLAERLHLGILKNWLVSRPRTYARERRQIGGLSVSRKDWLTWATALIVAISAPVMAWGATSGKHRWSAILQTVLPILSFSFFRFVPSPKEGATPPPAEVPLKTVSPRVQLFEKIGRGLALAVPTFFALKSYLHGGVVDIPLFSPLIQGHASFFSGIPILGPLVGTGAANAVLSILFTIIVFETISRVVEHVLYRPLLAGLGFRTNGVSIFSSKAHLLQNLRENYQLGSSVEELHLETWSRYSLLRLANNLEKAVGSMDELQRAQERSDRKKARKAGLLQVIHNLPGGMRQVSQLLFWVSEKVSDVLDIIYQITGKYFETEFMRRYVRSSTPDAAQAERLKEVARRYVRLSNASGDVRTAGEGNVAAQTSRVANAAAKASNRAWKIPGLGELAMLWQTSVFARGTEQMVQKRFSMALISSIGIGFLYAILGPGGLLARNQAISETLLNNSGLWIVAPVLLGFRIIGRAIMIYRSSPKGADGSRAPPVWRVMLRELLRPTLFFITVLTLLLFMPTLAFSASPLWHNTYLNIVSPTSIRVLNTIDLNLAMTAIVSPFLTSLGLNGGRLLREEILRMRSIRARHELMGLLPPPPKEEGAVDPFATVRAMFQDPRLARADFDMNHVESFINALSRIPELERLPIANQLAAYVLNGYVLKPGTQDMDRIRDYDMQHLFEMLTPMTGIIPLATLQKSAPSRWADYPRAFRTFGRYETWDSLFKSTFAFWTVNPEIQAVVGIAAKMDHYLSPVVTGSVNVHESEIISHTDAVTQADPANAKPLAIHVLQHDQIIDHAAADHMLSVVNALPPNATPQQIHDAIVQAASTFTGISDTVNLAESTQNGVMGIGEVFSKWVNGLLHLDASQAAYLVGGGKGNVHDYEHLMMQLQSQNLSQEERVNLLRDIAARRMLAQTRVPGPPASPAPAPAKPAPPTTDVGTNPPEEQKAIVEAAQERVKHAGDGALENTKKAQEALDKTREVFASLQNRGDEAGDLAALRNSIERTLPTQESFADALPPQLVEAAIQAMEAANPKAVRESVEAVQEARVAKLSEAGLEKPGASVVEETLNAYKQLSLDLGVALKDLQDLPQSNQPEQEKVQKLSTDLEALHNSSENVQQLKLPLTTLTDVMIPLGLVPEGKGEEVLRLGAAVREGTLDRALQAAQTLWESLQNWKNPLVRLKSLQDRQNKLEKDIESVRSRLSDQPQDRFTQVSSPERILMAAQIPDLDRAVADLDARLASLRNPSRPWADALRQVRDILETARQAQGALRANDVSVTPAARYDALQAARKALISLPSLLPQLKLFDPANLERDMDFEAMPISADTLTPEARRTFLLFMSDHPELDALSELEAIQQWYLEGYKDLTAQGFLPVIQAVISGATLLMADPANHANQIASVETDAEASSKSLASLQLAIDQLEKNRRDLVKLMDETRLNVASAEKQAPSVQLEGSLQPTVQDVADLQKALEQTKKLKYKAEGPQLPLFGEKTDRADELKDFLAKVEAELKALNLTPGQKDLTPEQAGQFAMTIGEIMGQMGDFIDGDHLNPGLESRKAVAGANDLVAIALGVAVRMAGLPPEAGAGAAELAAHQALSGAQASVRHQAEKQFYQDYLKRTGAWVSWWDAVVLGNIITGAFAYQTNIYTLAKKNVSYRLFNGNPVSDAAPIPVSQLVIKILAADPGSAVVAVANGVILAKGTVDEARQVMGYRPRDTATYFASQLPAHVFGKLAWAEVPGGRPAVMAQSLHEASKSPVPVYFDLPEIAHPGETAPHVTVMQAQAKHLKVSDVLKHPNVWRPVPDSEVLSVRFYTVIDGHRYVYEEKPITIKQRIYHLGRGSLAGVLGYELLKATVKGEMFRDRIVPYTPQILTRAIAALNLVGPAYLGVKTVDRLLETIRYRKLAHSENGGWIRGDKPGFVGTFNLSKDGVDTTYWVGKDGQVYTESRDESGRMVLLSQDGAPEIRVTKGLKNRLKSFLTLRFNSAERYIPSMKDTRKAVDSKGHFYRARQGSVKLEMVDADHLTSNVPGTGQVNYQMAPVMEVELEGRSMRVRPYYRLKPDNTVGELAGAVEVDRNNSPRTSTIAGRTIVSFESLYNWVTSEKEKQDSVRHFITEGDWTNVNNPVAQSIDRIGWPKITGNGWTQLPDGTFGINFVNEKPTFQKWIEPDGRMYVLDQRDPLAKTLYRLEKIGGRFPWAITGVKSTSLKDLAKTKLLGNSEGEFFNQDVEGRAPAAGKVVYLPMQGINSNDAQAWTDSNGQFHLHVDRPVVIHGISLGRGNWLYTPGVRGVTQTSAELDAPFSQANPTPVPLDLEALAKAAHATVQKRTTPQGEETTYTFTPSASTKGPQLTGTFIEIKEGNTVRTEYLTSSAPGMAYEKAGIQSTEPTFWKHWDTLPANLSGWVKGNVPAAISAHLNQWMPGSANSAMAEYAFDARSGGYYLRVTVSSERTERQVFTFHSELSVAGSSELANKVKNGSSGMLLASDLPDDLMKKLPAYELGYIYQGTDGRWYYRVDGRGASASRLVQIQGGVFADIMPEGMTIEQLAARLPVALKAKGKSIEPASSDPFNTYSYGAMDFMPYTNPYDPADKPDHHAYTILVAARDGNFFDLSVIGSQPIPLKKGQILILSNGLSDARDQLAHAQSPLPQLLPALRTWRMIEEKAGANVIPVGTPNGHLPAFLGAGAEAIEGQWYKEKHIDPKTGLATLDFTYFRAARTGSYNDAVTGKTIMVNSDSVWVIDPSPEGIKRFNEFHGTWKAGWTATLADPETLVADYRTSAQARGLAQANLAVPNQAPLFTVPGTGIQGQLMEPTLGDALAPNVLIVTTGGPYHDPLLGDINLRPGDTLVLQVPARHQAALLGADQNSVMLLDSVQGERVVSVNPNRFNDPALGGIKPASEIPVAERIELGLSEKALVQVDASGQVLGQVQLGERGLAQIAQYQSGLGYVQMNPGQFTASFQTGTPGTVVTRNLAGWVAIGNGPNDIPYSVATDKRYLTPANGINGKGGWNLVYNGRVLGNIQFGTTAARLSALKALKPAQDLLKEALAGPPYEHQEALVYNPDYPAKEFKNGDYEITLEHLFTHMRRVEHYNKDEVLLSREYFDQNGKSFKKTFYNGVLKPLRSIDGDGKEIEVYRVDAEGQYLTMETRAPNNGPILKLQRWDKAGHIIWEWDAQSETAQIYHYDPTVVNGRAINQNGQREAVTSMETRRMNRFDLNLEARPAPQAAPGTAPRFRASNPIVRFFAGVWEYVTNVVHAQNNPPATPPAPQPQTQVRDPLTLDLTSGYGSGLGRTVYDPVIGMDRPIYHVTPGGKIDEVYVTLPLTADKERKTQIYILPVPLDFNALEGQALIDDYRQRLLPEALKLKVFETRTYDVLGRLRLVELGTAWKTVHEYVGSTGQLLHSQLTYNDQLVHDVYYPDFTNANFSEALLGIDPDLFERSIPDANQRQALRARLIDAGLARNPALGSWDQLPQSLKDELVQLGLSPTTKVQIAVVVTSAGGISVDLRRPNDPTEQLLINLHGADRTISVGWEGRSVKKSYLISPSDPAHGRGIQITAEYETLQSVKARDIIPAKYLTDVAVLGIDPDSLLPVVEERRYGILGKVVPTQFDANGVPVAYDADLTWTPAQKIRNKLYLIPNHPLGLNIVSSFQFDGWALNQWWLMGTNRTNAPIGILPGSIIMDPSMRENGIKTFIDRVNIVVRGLNGATRTYPAFQYEIQDASEMRGDAYTVTTGRLVDRTYAWVRLRLANVVPLIAGEETINYDPALAFEVATNGTADYQGSKGETKQLLSVDFSIEKGQIIERQLWREREPLMGEQVKTWVRLFVDGKEQGPIHRLFPDSIDEYHSVPSSINTAIWRSVIIALLTLIGLGRVARFLLRKDINRARLSVGPIGTPASSLTGSTPDAIMKKGPRVNAADQVVLEKAIEEILLEIGLQDLHRYYVKERVLAEIRDMIPGADGNLHPEAIFDEMMSGLEAWRKKTGRSSGNLTPQKDGKDELRRIVLMEWMTQEMVRNGFAAIADLPSLIFYEVDKSIGMYNRGAKAQISSQIHSELDALIAYLRQQYGLKGVLKDGRLTYDDFSDLFEDKSFLERYDGALAGMPGQGLQQFYASLTPKDKPFDDRIGFFAAMRNLAPVMLAVFLPVLWIIIDPLIIAAGVSPDTRAAFAIIVGLPYVGAMLFLGRTSIKQFIQSKAARSQLMLFVPYYASIIAIWGAASWFLNWWAWRVVLQIAAFHWGWSIPIGIGVGTMLSLFAVLGIFNIPMIVGSFFAYFGMSRAGIGKIRRWSGVAKYFSRARERFQQVMVPPELAPYWDTPARRDQLWKEFWGKFIEDHLRSEDRGDYLITEEEKQMLLSDPPEKWRPIENPEGRWRIERGIGSFLMAMPHAKHWDRTRALSITVTGFAEPIVMPYSDLNVSENPNDFTTLNKVISVFPHNWISFAKSFDANVRQELIDHMRAIASGDLSRKLRADMPPDVQLRIETWVSTRTQPLEKTVREVAIIREAFKFVAHINFPTASDRELDQIVDQKLQILINYSSLGIQALDPKTGDPIKGVYPNDVQVAKAEALMAEYPYMEWRWGKDSIVRGSPANVVGRLPLGYAVLGGKPFAMNEVLPWLRHNKILFFDINASVHWEEAIKLPLSLSEFDEDTKLKFVLFGEYIYNRPLGWATDAVGLGEETWTQEEQELLSIFGAVGFYGHSAEVDRQALIRSGGYPHQFSGEDTIMTIKFWLLGYRTLHRNYILLGKSRWASFHGGMTPTGRWSQNVAEYFLSRWLTRLLRSGKLNIAQVLVAMKSMGFFPKKALIPLLNDLYNSLIILLGVSGTIGLKGILILGGIGLVMNQGNAMMAWFHLMRRKGIIPGTLEFGALFPPIYSAFVPIIPNYGLRFNNALFEGQGGFAISGKGLDLRWFKFREIYFGDEKAYPQNERWVWNIKGYQIPKLLVLQTAISIILAAGVLWLPTAGKSLALVAFLIGQQFFLWGLAVVFPKVRREMWPKDASKRSAIRLQMLFAMPMMVRVVLGLWLWGGIPAVWPYWLAQFFFMGLYIKTSFAWQRRQLILSELAQREGAGSSFWTRMKEPGLRVLIAIGFLGTIASIIIGTLLASPMFTLFAFSIFYLGVPFATFIIPLYGHVRPIKKFTNWVKTHRAPRFSPPMIRTTPEAGHVVVDGLDVNGWRQTYNKIMGQPGTMRGRVSRAILYTSAAGIIAYILWHYFGVNWTSAAAFGGTTAAGLPPLAGKINEGLPPQEKRLIAVLESVPTTEKQIHYQKERDKPVETRTIKVTAWGANVESMRRAIVLLGALRRIRDQFGADVMNNVAYAWVWGSTGNNGAMPDSDIDVEFQWAGSRIPQAQRKQLKDIIEDTVASQGIEFKEASDLLAPEGLQRSVNIMLGLRMLKEWADTDPTNQELQHYLKLWEPKSGPDIKGVTTTTLGIAGVLLAAPAGVHMALVAASLALFGIIKILPFAGRQVQPAVQTIKDYASAA